MVKRPHFWGGYVRGGRLTGHKGTVDDSEIRRFRTNLMEVGSLSTMICEGSCASQVVSWIPSINSIHEEA